MDYKTRPISWIKPAKKDFEGFPAGAQTEMVRALTGLGSGMLEVALRHWGDAYRVVYALQVGPAIWIIHAFQKKSAAGIAIPKHEIDLVRERLKRLKEAL